MILAILLFNRGLTLWPQSLLRNFVIWLWTCSMVTKPALWNLLFGHWPTLWLKSLLYRACYAKAILFDLCRSCSVWTMWGLLCLNYAGATLFDLYGSCLPKLCRSCYIGVAMQELLCGYYDGAILHSCYAGLPLIFVIIDSALRDLLCNHRLALRDCSVFMLVLCGAALHGCSVAMFVLCGAALQGMLCGHASAL